MCGHAQCAHTINHFIAVSMRYKQWRLYALFGHCRHELVAKGQIGAKCTDTGKAIGQLVGSVQSYGSSLAKPTEDNLRWTDTVTTGHLTGI